MGGAQPGCHPRLPHVALDPGEWLSGGYDGAKPKKGSKIHAAVDTLLGELLALRVGPANEDDREQVDKLSREIQQATAETWSWLMSMKATQERERRQRPRARHPP